MKRLLFILAIAAALCGCKKKHANEPVPLYIGFDVQRVSPLMVEFTNRSTGFDEYKWDFGDGTYAFGINAMHGYESTGKYPVTLIGTVDGKKYDCTEYVTINDPYVYFAGFRLYKIPYENRYYKLVFKDDNLLPSSWDFQTTYTPMLDNSYLPYTMYFTNPRRLENIDSHTQYTIQVMRTTNAGSSSGDVQCMKQALKVKDIKTYQPEYILRTGTDGTAVGILMEYEY